MLHSALRRRTAFLCFPALMLACCTAFSATAATAADRPNVLLINVDDLGWVDVNCFRERFRGEAFPLPTPNVDRLAREGMLFSDAYAACHVCSPTRAAIMSGQYPARTKVTDWIRPNRARKVAADWQPGLTNPVRGVRIAENQPFLRREVTTLAELLGNAGYATGHVGKWHLGREEFYPQEQGFDFNRGGGEWGHPFSGYFDPYGGNMPHMPPRKKGEYLAFRETDEVIHFLRERDPARPFFVNYWPYEVHTPVQAPSELVDKAPAGLKGRDAKYAAMVHALDLALGRVLDYLDDHELTERTLVIFTSDNGGLFGNAPLRANKGTPYEGGVRIPQIVRWPGRVEPGTVCSVPVISTDLLPTVCEAVGVPLPQAPLDGVSLVPLLTGKATALDRDALYWHFPHFRRKVHPHSAVRQGDWKLIWYYTEKKPELFNLRDDRAEHNNLAEQEPEKVHELKRLIDRFNRETEALVPTGTDTAER